MQDELLKRLDLMAANLGVATEHLYSVLIKQVYVDAAYSGLWLIVGIILACSIKPIFNKIRKMEDDGPYSDCLGSTIWIVCSAIASVVIIGFSTQVFIQILNPEYAAIKEILGVLK